MILLGLAAEFLGAFEAGINDAAQSGVLGGYPVIDWKVTMLSAGWQESESSELAFENAARASFYEAMKAAGPVLLEPIMDVEVVTSDEYFGSIMGDLNARKAVVRNTTLRGADRLISADVSLSQMFGYVTKLRSLSHYVPVSPADLKMLAGWVGTHIQFYFSVSGGVTQ